VIIPCSVLSPLPLYLYDKVSLRRLIVKTDDVASTDAAFESGSSNPAKAGKEIENEVSDPMPSSSFRSSASLERSAHARLAPLVIIPSIERPPIPNRLATPCNPPRRIRPLATRKELSRPPRTT
jgi:hypothetical protein